MPCNEMSKKKKLATRYQCMKAFFHKKVDKKPNILELIHTLIPQKASIDLCPRHGSRNLVLATYILVLFHNVTFVSLFAAK